MHRCKYQRRHPSRSPVRRASRSQELKFLTIFILQVRWFFDPSDQNELYNPHFYLKYEIKAKVNYLVNGPLKSLERDDHNYSSSNNARL